MGLVTWNLMLLRHSQVSVALSLRAIIEKPTIRGQESHKVFFYTNRRHPTRSVLSLVKKRQQAVTRNCRIIIVKFFSLLSVSFKSEIPSRNLYSSHILDLNQILLKHK